MDAALRPCRKCGVPKAATEFYADRQRPDGLRRLCKVCDRARLDSLDQARKARRATEPTNGVPTRAKRGWVPNPQGNPAFGKTYKGHLPKRPPPAAETFGDVLHEVVGPNLRTLIDKYQKLALDGDKLALKELMRLVAEHSPPPVGRLERLYRTLVQEIYAAAPQRGAEQGMLPAGEAPTDDAPVLDLEPEAVAVRDTEETADTAPLDWEELGGGVRRLRVLPQG